MGFIGSLLKGGRRERFDDLLRQPWRAYVGAGQ
jgi:hypothetical protein